MEGPFKRASLEGTVFAQLPLAYTNLRKTLVSLFRLRQNQPECHEKLCRVIRGAGKNAYGLNKQERL